MLEKQIEKNITNYINKLGGLSLKLNSIRGIPDRLILLPSGIIFFIEFKAPKQKPKPLQLIVHNRINKLGFNVLIIDDIEKGKQLINEQIKIKKLSNSSSKTHNQES